MYVAAADPVFRLGPPAGGYISGLHVPTIIRPWNRHEKGGNRVWLKRGTSRGFDRSLWRRRWVYSKISFRVPFSGKDCTGSDPGGYYFDTPRKYVSGICSWGLHVFPTQFGDYMLENREIGATTYMYLRMHAISSPLHRAVLRVTGFPCSHVYIHQAFGG